MDEYDLEVAIPYWRSIAKTLRCDVSTIIKHKQELKDAGVIFYRRGRSNKRFVYHFPSRLKAWAGLKGSRDEIV